MSGERPSMPAWWRGDAGCGLVLAAAGAIFAALSLRMPLLEDGVPGPGMAPAGLGVALAGLGLWCAVSAAWRGAGAAAAGADRDVWLAIGLLTAAVALFEPAGFLPVTFAFLAGYLLLIGRLPAFRAVAVAAAMTAVVWGVFSGLLGVGLPAGLVPIR